MKMFEEVARSLTPQQAQVYVFAIIAIPLVWLIFVLVCGGLDEIVDFLKWELRRRNGNE